MYRHVFMNHTDYVTWDTTDVAKTVQLGREIVTIEDYYLENHVAYWKAPLPMTLTITLIAICNLSF